MLDSRYSAYYGFTEFEVKTLANRYGIDNNTTEVIQKWYNGYNIGDYRIYNPWSVLKVFARYSEGQGFNSSFLRSYWEESGTINFTKNLFLKKKMKHATQKLINGESLSLDVVEQFTMDDFMDIKKMIKLGSNYEMDDTKIDLIFSYLLMAGYLTPTDQETRYRMPNQEIRIEFSKKLQRFYKANYSIDSDLFDNVTDDLQKILDSKKGKQSEQLFEDFRKSFADLVKAMPEFGKIRDADINSKAENVVVHANEDIVHSVLNYIVLRLNSLHKFGSEVYLGKGRADIIFISEEKAIIIELKYDGSSDEAVSQIITQKYANSIGTELDQILLGLNVNPDKSVEISHNLDLEELLDNVVSSGVSEVSNDY